MCIAAVSKEGFWDNGHVSRALNVSYLRPVPSGTEIRIECEGVHLGRKLAMVRGRMVRVSDGKVCYVCEHQKAALEKDAGSRL
jgi:acyl-coenzyme A thioesterase 13